MRKNYFSLEKSLSSTGGSIYKLVVLAAKRAIAFTEGEKPLLERKTEKLLDAALEEIEKNKIKEATGEKKKQSETQKKDKESKPEKEVEEKEEKSSAQ